MTAKFASRLVAADGDTRHERRIALLESDLNHASVARASERRAARREVRRANRALNIAR